MDSTRDPVHFSAYHDDCDLHCTSDVLPVSCSNVMSVVLVLLVSTSDSVEVHVSVQSRCYQRILKSKKKIGGTTYFKR